MRNKSVQMSLEDIYNDVFESMERKESGIVSLLEEHIDMNKLIPNSFKSAFYQQTGRDHVYHLDSLLWFVVLKKLFGFSQNTQMLNVLKCSRELRELCGFRKVPDLSQITRFYQKYSDHIATMFEHLVDVTEPICREISKEKADYLIFDTTGIEAKVSENNPKFFNTKLNQAKSIKKTDPNYNPYTGVYSLLPSQSEANPEIRQQYINGHFCYAIKAGIVTNGLGIVRHIAVFDNDFKTVHPELKVQKTDDPTQDKEIGDSSALKPILTDFFKAHPKMHPSTFLGDSAFDSYETYSMLKKDFGFARAVIPMNPRNSKKADASDESDVVFNEVGTPICQKRNEEFTYVGKCGGKNRSLRFKWVCPQSVRVPKSSKRVCTCETPCTDSSYGRCVYTYPDKDFRLCPGVPRNTELWDDLYKHRVTVERTINLLKDSFALSENRSFRSVSLKTDLYLSGIVQLIGVILADRLHKPNLFKSVRKLLAC